MINLKTNKNPKNWWLQSEQEVSRNLNTDSHGGLSKSEAKKRLQEFGHNQLLEQQKISIIHLFFDQFLNFIVWILIAAAIIAGVLREWIDAFAIIAIVILNALLGFFQEYKAEKFLAVLRKMVTCSSKVIRDGKLQTLPSKEIVPGDLILIEAGDRIPADGRFIRSFGLSTQEAALTGESMPIHKTADSLEGYDLALGDKKNLGFLGAVAVSGKGYMIVTETGTQTELGKIASLLQHGSEEQTPLQKRLQELGLRLVWCCLGIVSLVFLFGFLKGTPLVENLLISIVACYFGMHKSGELAQTMAFTTLVVLELVAVQIIRSPYNLSILSNPLIIAAVALSFLMQLFIVYTPFLQSVFKTVPLSTREWGIISAITIIVWILCEVVNQLFKQQTVTRK